MKERLTAAHFVRRRRTRCSSSSREDCACRVVLRFLRSCRSRSQRPPTYPSPMCSDTHVLAWRAKRQLDGAAELELSCLRTRAPVLGQLVDPTYREHPVCTHTFIVDRGAVLLSHPLSPPSSFSQSRGFCSHRVELDERRDINPTRRGPSVSMYRLPTVQQRRATKSHRTRDIAPSTKPPASRGPPL